MESYAHPGEGGCDCDELKQLRKSKVELDKLTKDLTKATEAIRQLEANGNAGNAVFQRLHEDGVKNANHLANRLMDTVQAHRGGAGRLDKMHKQHKHKRRKRHKEKEEERKRRKKEKEEEKREALLAQQAAQLNRELERLRKRAQRKRAEGNEPIPEAGAERRALGALEPGELGARELESSESCSDE